MEEEKRDAECGRSGKNSFICLLGVAEFLALCNGFFFFFFLLPLFGFPAEQISGFPIIATDADWAVLF